MTTPAVSSTDVGIFDWLQMNRRWVGIGAAVVVVAAAGWWLYSRTAENRARSSAQALNVARRSLTAGNPELAVNDLERLVARYGSTTSGVEGAMILAQIHYDAGRYQQGLTVLEQVEDDAPAPVRTGIHSLIGDGQSQLGKHLEAAQAYEAAAAATTLPIEAGQQLARAARAYEIAGNQARALEIWTNLAEDRKLGPVAAEARVRLGELTAKPAGGN